MTEPSSSATPRGSYKRFTDPDGREWLVWRISEADVEEIREPSSLARPWLVFLGPNGETRRLAPVPPRWRRFDDEELFALAQRAKPFTQQPDR